MLEIILLLSSQEGRKILAFQTDKITEVTANETTREGDIDVKPIAKLVQFTCNKEQINLYSAYNIRSIYHTHWTFLIRRDTRHMRATFQTMAMSTETLKNHVKNNSSARKWLLMDMKKQFHIYTPRKSEEIIEEISPFKHKKR
jgi:hypothetical protein